VHGQLITVAPVGVAAEQRAALHAQIDERLDPLTIRHRIV
jgi:hypothetical protein